MQRLTRNFFQRDVLDVAPDLLGKVIVTSTLSAVITEVEVYRGEEDLACHASKGRTARTEVMYGPAGHIYVYLIYGMYWMLNIVTGYVNQPQAVLIRSIQALRTKDQGIINGPGRVGRWLNLDKTFYAEDLIKSHRIWIEESSAINHKPYTLKTAPRIGVDYAGEWAKKPWRFML